MKKYQKPQLSMTIFKTEDILTLSSPNIDGGGVNFPGVWINTDVDGGAVTFIEEWEK